MTMTMIMMMIYAQFNNITAPHVQKKCLYAAERAYFHRGYLSSFGLQCCGPWWLVYTVDVTTAAWNRTSPSPSFILLCRLWHHFSVECVGR